jgi:transposase
MTTHQLTPHAGVLVALDIAKTRNEVLLEIPGQRRRRRLTLLNTRAEHDRLIALLLGLGQPVTCGFEATGNYHRPIAWRLIQAGFEVRLISSLALARTREALHNSWDKNDPKDAQVILHMLRIGASQHYHDPLAAGINDVQELSKTHEAVSQAKTEVLHRLLTHYLPLYFPEIDRFRRSNRSDWFFAFLDRFPTPASVMALSKEAFIGAAWDVVGRKVAKERVLADIYETAKSSIGLPVPPDAPAVRMFRLVIAQARSLLRQREEIEHMADALLNGSEDYRRLRQIPGVGPILRGARRENPSQQSREGVRTTL